MKHRVTVMIGSTLAGGLVLAASPAHAQSAAIDQVNKWSWGENIGWLNWGDAGGGDMAVTVMPTHLEGFIWAENVGWINVGNGGGPYQNNDHTDFGVNIEGDGSLSGFAWGENIGWINFDTFDALNAFDDHARFDAEAERFFGYSWGENVGWINLNDATHYVGTDCPCPGDVTGDDQVNFDDLNIVLFAWGAMDGDFNYVPEADLNADGAVDFDDLNLVLDGWGSSACTFPCTDD